MYTIYLKRFHRRQELLLTCLAKTAINLNGYFMVGIAVVVGNAEHIVDDVGVNGCRLLVKRWQAGQVSVLIAG